MYRTGTLAQSVLEEVKQLQREGHSSLFLSDDSMRLLRSQEAPEPSAQMSAQPVRAHKPQALASKQVAAPVLETRSTAPALKKATQPHEVYTSAPIPDPESFTLPSGSKQLQWDWLRDHVLGSKVCNAHVKPGKRVVFGVGSLDADIFFCGEAPGAEEEVQGEPFVGPAGQLLTKILQAMGLERSRVYIGNIMNWRPEMPTEYGNRPPTDRELAYCLPFLKAQLKIVAPKAIVALGATAVSGLLGPDPKRRMGDIRGVWQQFEGVPLMVTYHPSYLLRNATARAKRQVWEDMMLVMERVGLPISVKQRNFFKD